MEKSGIEPEKNEVEKKLQKKTRSIFAEHLKSADLAPFANSDQKRPTGLGPAQARKFLAQMGFQFPKKNISFQMLKGGVAKTTSALNLGLRAAMYGAKVLFIDLDQQANLSFALGVEDENNPVWVDVFEKKIAVEQAILKLSDQIDLIPSSLNNSVLDRAMLNSQRHWIKSIEISLAPIQARYDLVIMDTAPHLSAVNSAVSYASDLVILPINPDKFSLSGARKNLDELQEIRKEFARDFETKILFSKYDGRENASREILSQCIDIFGDQLLNSYIRHSADVKNTIASTKSIFSHASSAKEDYDALTCEILGWTDRMAGPTPA